MSKLTNGDSAVRMQVALVLATVVLVTVGAGALVYARASADKSQASAPKVESKEKGKESAMEVTVTQENFEQEVLKSERSVLVDFWATWCGPCRMLSPIIGEIAVERAGTLKVGKVNVDEAPELAARFGITGIPALLLFKGGKVVATSVGYVSKEDLSTFLDKHAQGN